MYQRRLLESGVPGAPPGGASTTLVVVATDVALDVTNTIFEVTGARATNNTVGLDRFWRNVRTHTLHDPVDYKKVEVGANYLLGEVQPISLYT